MVEREPVVPADVVARIVAALLPGAGRSSVVLGAGVLDDERYQGPGEVLDGRELSKAIREGAATVVILRRTTPTVLRALRTNPVDLLVITGDDGTPADSLAPLATCVLGPDAVLHVDESAVGAPACALACADTPAELEGIARALRPRPLLLRLAPAPEWLPALLEHPTLATTPIAGTLGRAALVDAWVCWVRARTTPAVLVPLGVTAPQLDGDDDEALRACVAAHALERRTGPVFPAPRVIVGVLDGLLRPCDDSTPAHATPEQLAIWAQARRALPITGGAVGMHAPRSDLALAAPTAAFLAQRVLLRAQAHAKALDEGPPALEALDEDGMHRSDELLRNAAEVLTDQESKVVLRGFGFDVTRQAVANSASGAAGFADRIGYPVALKVLSPDLRRRTDVGGVKLSLETASAVRRGYSGIINSVEQEAPTARIDGIVVAEMIGEGLDIRCGARRLDDEQVVAYGRIEGASSPVEGALALMPLRPEDALALAHAVLSRAPMPALRRHSDPDVPGLAALFSRLSEMFEHTADRILGVDLGPVRLVESRGLVTLDARITQRAHLQGL